jgi:cell wall-associated NlpC family hydrolase
MSIKAGTPCADVASWRIHQCQAVLLQGCAARSLTSMAEGSATVGAEPSVDAALPLASPEQPRGLDRYTPMIAPRDSGIRSRLSSEARIAVAWSLAQRGQPYVWGGIGNRDGFDCSGLVLRAYQAVGIHLPRTSRAQFVHGVSNNQLVQLREFMAFWTTLVLGDLIFFAVDRMDPTTIHHVGMYVGNGYMIHAPRTGAVVGLQSLNARSYRHEFIGATRPTVPIRDIRQHSINAGATWRQRGSGAS